MLISSRVDVHCETSVKLA